jgi:predicted Zn-dependent peptidase
VLCPPRPTTQIGVCHFLENTAFKGTKNHTTEQILQLAATQGLSSSAIFNREVIMYRVDVLRGGASGPLSADNAEATIRNALSLLADTVSCPTFSEDDMSTARRTIAFQRAEMAAQPTWLVSEHLYTAAFGEGTPLGRPEKCPASRIGTAADGTLLPSTAGDFVTADTLRSYMAQYFTSGRMVLAGVGVDHDLVTSVAQEVFADLRTHSDAGAMPGRPASPYVGGDVRSSPDWAALPRT